MVCWYNWHSPGNSWFPKVRLFWEKIVFSQVSAISVFGSHGRWTNLSPRSWNGKTTLNQFWRFLKPISGQAQHIPGVFWCRPTCQEMSGVETLDCPCRRLSCGIHVLTSGWSSCRPLSLLMRIQKIRSLPCEGWHSSDATWCDTRVISCYLYCGMEALIASRFPV